MNSRSFSAGPFGDAATDWRLTVITSNLTDLVGEQLTIGRRLIIGRDTSCDIVLADPNVSRRHAAIEPFPAGLRVVDLGSGNGVWVDGHRVEASTLIAGQQFRVGATVFECLAPKPVLSPPSDAPTTLLKRPDLSHPGEPGRADRRPFIVRILEGNERGRAVTVGEGIATIGRAADSSVVLSGRDVSRRHAQIESTLDGFVITDAGSSYGLWVGGTEVKSHLLKSGETFRLGQSVVLECVYVEDETASPDATMYVQRGSTVPPPVPRTLASTATTATTALAPAGPEGTAGPAKHKEETPPVKPVASSSSSAASRQHVAAPSSAPPFRWALDDTAEVLPVLPPPPSHESVTDDDFSQTVVMPIPVGIVEQGRRIEDEGEALALFAHQPLLLNDPEAFYYVVSGAVLIFTIPLENGVPVGSRTHFLGIMPGQCFLGFNGAGGGVGSGFLAVAKPGTSVRQISRARIRVLAAAAKTRETIAGLLDGWIGGLSQALVADQPVRRSSHLVLNAGKRVEIDTATKATAGEGVLWIELFSGSVTFDDLATPVFSRRRVLFPVTPASWIQPLSDEFGPLHVTPVATATALTDDASWHGLDAFHQSLRESEFIKGRLATVDEYLRLEERKVRLAAAAKAGYDAIGSVMRSEAATPFEFRASTPAEAVFGACQLAGRVLGIEVRQPPANDDDLTFEERMSLTASASGYRTRVVALRDDWWTHDHGPMVGQIAATGDPVALLPDGPHAYVMAGPNTVTPQRLTAAAAASLSGFAYTMYRPFPEALLKVGEVIRFGARNLWPDMRWVVAMAVVIGMAGMVTPWLTGRVFDSAIPDADASALYGFGAALVATAIATSLFKLTQGIATVRIQARMSSTIQASVWDRMLNLPVNFFRKFSAGDLADRAAGVEDIQQLAAGAGVAAVLGSVSGTFFVFQMFTYNRMLAVTAVLLTAVFVGVNVALNRWQLRSQRREIRIRGRIAGLVLNLITGVAKLRIGGAEQHAFRVWAQQFASQRKISFSVGQIQNSAATFASFFPIVSSMVLFYVVVQQRETVVPGQPALTTGEFIAFNAAFGLFLAATQALGDASLSLLRIVPIYERLMPILTETPEVDRSKGYPGKLTGAIELSNLRFRYDGDGPLVINGVTLTINPGEFVALVGPSGCGKSTLMRLMLGFEAATSGSIRYDGQELRSLDIRAVRRQMGVVMQQSRVMPTEMYRNIIGVTTRTLEDAWEAAGKAGLADDIRNMPMGMHTYVSEGGGTLSGGQRQRLMIARAIVNRPKIIFLDEATSALDNRTQAIVTESMDKMAATRVVIAHRLSTIEHADRICYLRDGQIVEMGSYEELMAKNGLFAELARRQMT